MIPHLRFGGAVVTLFTAACGPSATPCPPAEGNPDGVGPAGYALQFCGTGRDHVDRVKIRVDDPLTEESGPPVDVGADDFTLEWWMKTTQDDRAGVVCGANLNWINGNIVFDRDRYNQGRKFGVSLTGGRLVFGVSGADDDHFTICGTATVADGRWHHVAIQRRRADGRMTVYVDGRLDAEGLGPAGDVSYPDRGVPLPFCAGRCFDSDPYLVMGAEKHDVGEDYPSYRGLLDEVRMSNSLRYAADFTPSATPFQPDSATVGLWHFDEGQGHVLRDSSPHAAHGLVRVGGPHEAPRWLTSDAPVVGRDPGTPQNDD